MFDINDESEDLKAKSSSVVFGLNAGFCSKFEFNPNGGKEGTPGDCLDVSFKIGESEVKHRVYPVTGEVYLGEDRIGPDHADYAATRLARQNEVFAPIVQLIKVLGVDPSKLSATKDLDFASAVKVIVGLLPEGFELRPIDIFLQYPWNLRSGQDRKYLEVPKNVKHGKVFVASKGSGWKKIVSESGLSYTNDKGETHPFERTTSYMESANADSGKAENTSPPAPSTNSNAAAKSSDWD